ncbi:carbonic anhydrase [Roseimicrobium gellanilyticum]|uniref:carbonic anhydrase n=2 Tax=Roseimicrobium gellanilyticum TaxID=748857 RepID=A0A366HNB9_9BACT|nr:carbonic anhydrase [Roseimicrobium gellanilyticum]
MVALSVSLAAYLQAKDPAPSEAAPTVTGAEALNLLKEGNVRFVADKLNHPHQDRTSRAELAKGQHPFAIVLGCADSRTSPELVFDQGLGDLFVIRVAGNVLNDETIGSIEYAVEHLGSPLIVVLAHERCGAVKAARDTIATNGKAPGHIQSLVKAIEPAVATTSSADAETTAKANALHVAKTLRESEPFLKEKAAAGKLTVVGAHYDLDTGKVEFLSEGAK